MSAILGLLSGFGELFHPSTMLRTGVDGDVVGRASGTVLVTGGFRLMVEDRVVWWCGKKRNCSMALCISGRVSALFSRIILVLFFFFFFFFFV